jgi:hypothetical protein
MFEFCGIVSNLLGSKAIDWSGIKDVGEDCYFTPLPYLVLITQIVIPIAIGIPAIFLIPNVYQTENLIDWAKEGWYSERIDRSVVSGLPPTVRCDDDDDDDGGDDDDYDDINDDDYDDINDDDDDDDDDDDNNNDEGEEDDDFEDSSSDVSNSEESAITEQRIV